MNPEHPSYLPPQEQETLSNLEKWLSSELPKQYEEKAKILNELGLLEILPESGEIGIVGIDGKEYPFPSEEQIRAEIFKNPETKELFETKMNQGFTELEITPFGLPLERLIDAAKKTILKHYKEGTLFGTRKNQDDESEPLEPLKLDENVPLSIWEELKDADTTGELIYYPQEFSKNHHGKTKQELLDASRNSLFPGFNVYLREKDINIPQGGQGKTQGNRKQLEAGKSSEEYLKILQTQEEYHHESGQTSEDWLTLFTTHLEKTNQVIDNEEEGCSDRLIGSYNFVTKSVPDAYWDCIDRHVLLDWDAPTVHDPSGGVRTVVRIPPLRLAS
ncbi:hypothetical protein KKH43_05565 [Patescibacteria group bacterium]|nr:hypothetical protein [Patescibacteria group bacterium]